MNIVRYFLTCGNVIFVIFVLFSRNMHNILKKYFPDASG
jgi:hypothetical protein